MNKTGFFLTANDTDVGKTYIGSRLVAAWQRMGHTVIPRKPVESGCNTVHGRLVPADAMAYFHAINGHQTLAQINPYRYALPLAPPQAAIHVKQSLSLTQLVRACEYDCIDEILLVEGAGGIMSPIAKDGLNIDLAHKLSLPLIIVVEDRLGSINQALLSIHCAQTRQLPVAAVIFNSITALCGPDPDNLNTLKKLSNVPVWSWQQQQQQLIHSLIL